MLMFSFDYRILFGTSNTWKLMKNPFIYETIMVTFGEWCDNENLEIGDLIEYLVIIIIIILRRIIGSNYPTIHICDDN